MSTRDEFSQKTKNAVAARAGWLCSFKGCAKSTVGPSEESPSAIAMIGVAAHICGAAPGRGSRRYMATMSQEERSGIENAIWLCQAHSSLIDRDAVTYTAAKLRLMKQEHEAACAQSICLGSKPELVTSLIAIGPEVICSGDISAVTADTWTLTLKHFVVGDQNTLISFIDSFATTAEETRYVLSNELGDGRLLSEAPCLIKQDGYYNLLCPVFPSFPRIDAQQIGSSIAMHPETGDMYVLNGQIARVSGVEYLPQKVCSVLSIQKGESVFAPSFGMRFFEYFEGFKNSPWLSLIMKLDVIRQAAIPYNNALNKESYTPLRCVTRVHHVELTSETPIDQRLPIRVDFDVQGIGRWQHDIEVYMPTKEQMNERARLLKDSCLS